MCVHTFPLMWVIVIHCQSKTCQFVIIFKGKKKNIYFETFTVYKNLSPKSSKMLEDCKQNNLQ